MQGGNLRRRDGSFLCFCLGEGGSNVHLWMFLLELLAALPRESTTLHGFWESHPVRSTFYGLDMCKSVVFFDWAIGQLLAY